jgi:hypothetical protein
MSRRSVQFIASVSLLLLLSAPAVSAKQVATTGRNLHRSLDSFLEKTGLDANDVVVQRGTKNYAGPHCPGAGWSCTKARVVIQIAVTGGQNESECTSSNKSNPCVIVQNSDGGSNVARCIQKSQEYGGSQQSTQACYIKQTNTTGENSARIQQTIYQKTKSGKQKATQRSRVEQANESGTNNVAATQKVDQYASGDPTGTQNQDSQQTFTLDQTSDSGPNNEVMHQSLNQNAVMKGYSESSSGSPSKPPSQVQNGLLEGFVDQESAGVSVGNNNQNGIQRLDAPEGTKQLQDPRIRCCSDQLGNPQDQFTIDQRFVQLASKPTAQYGEDVGECFTTGICTITQRAKQNNAKKTNFVSGTGLVTASIICVGKGPQNKCVAKKAVGGD